MRMYNMQTFEFIQKFELIATKLDWLLKLRWPITASLSDARLIKVSDKYLDLKSG